MTSELGRGGNSVGRFEFLSHRIARNQRERLPIARDGIRQSLPIASSRPSRWSGSVVSRTRFQANNVASPNSALRINLPVPCSISGIIGWTN